MKYLLDTNILSALQKSPRGEVTRKLAVIGIENVATSIIVASEWRFGAAKSRSPSLIANIEDILATLIVLPFEQPADRVYAGIRAALEAKGTPIGGNDLLIAAQALALDLSLVTDNVGEFARVPGLKIENWLRPDD
jgi:tRNA(fMet)-specific endonuclease VapC